MNCVYKIRFYKCLVSMNEKLYLRAIKLFEKKEVFLDYVKT